MLNHWAHSPHPQTLPAHLTVSWAWVAPMMTQHFYSHRGPRSCHAHWVVGMRTRNPAKKYLVCPGGLLRGGRRRRALPQHARCQAGDGALPQTGPGPPGGTSRPRWHQLALCAKGMFARRSLLWAAGADGQILVDKESLTGSHHRVRTWPSESGTPERNCVSEDSLRRIVTPSMFLSKCCLLAKYVQEQND